MPEPTTHALETCPCCGGCAFREGPVVLGDEFGSVLYELAPCDACDGTGEAAPSQPSDPVAGVRAEWARAVSEDETCPF